MNKHAYRRFGVPSHDIPERSGRRDVGDSINAFG